jgi:hypothetical protein
MRSDININFSLGCFPSPANPGDSIQAAVQRRRLGMVPSEAIGLEQAISEADAWKCFRI